VFNPRSVVATLSSKSYDNYWTRTGTYEALKIYIDSEFVNAIESPQWTRIAQVLKASQDLLKATWSGDADAVAAIEELRVSRPACDGGRRRGR
jgi:hypothetical protein